MHKDPSQYLARLRSARLHRSRDLEMWAIDRPAVEALAALLERRTSFGLSVSERSLLVSIGDRSIEANVVRHVLDE